MNDRYRDSRDPYGEDQYGRYDNAYQGGQSRRSSRSYDDRYDARSQQSSQSYQSYSRQSNGYSSSNAAGAYANDRRSGSTVRRDSYGGDSRRREPANAFSDHYSDERVDAYRRSSYGSGSSRSRVSQTQAVVPPSARTVMPAQQGSSRSPYAATQGAYTSKRSNRKRNIIIAAVIVLAVVLVGAGAAWAYVNSISNNLHQGIDKETLEALEPAEGTATATSLGETPFYMLLMGTDTSVDRVENEEDYADGSARSDSMMLARVDPVNKKVALISIHRDTMVDMGEYGPQKINAAYQYWGPAGAIQAVSSMAGVPISHYASVDFDGFSAIVDALGGVEVNVPMEINDEVMPAHLDAGWQTLDGEGALVLCRSRHSYDDVANDGDVMRAANQRMVISAIAKKILSSDLMTIASSVQTLSKYVTTDLQLSDIIGLAQIFQGINPDNDIYTAMEPTTSAYIDDTWYEYLDEPAWREMIARMDQGLPPVNKTEIDDATGTILSTGGADAPVV